MRRTSGLSADATSGTIGLGPGSVWSLALGSLIRSRAEGEATDQTRRLVAAQPHGSGADDSELGLGSSCRDLLREAGGACRREGAPVDVAAVGDRRAVVVAVV